MTSDKPTSLEDCRHARACHFGNHVPCCAAKSCSDAKCQTFAYLPKPGFARGLPIHALTKIAHRSSNASINRMCSCMQLQFLGGCTLLFHFHPYSFGLKQPERLQLELYSVQSALSTPCLKDAAYSSDTCASLTGRQESCPKLPSDDRVGALGIV